MFSSINASYFRASSFTSLIISFELRSITGLPYIRLDAPMTDDESTFVYPSLGFDVKEFDPCPLTLLEFNPYFGFTFIMGPDCKTSAELAF